MISNPAVNAQIGAPKPVYPTLTNTPVRAQPMSSSATGSVKYAR